MARYLLIDIGAGTMDVLAWDDQTDLHHKAVVLSPVHLLAAEVERTTGDLLVTGGEMGGGPVSRALIHRAKVTRVTMTTSAAATIHHDPERVRGHGIEIIPDGEAAGRGQVHLADVQAERLERIVSAFGVPFAFEAIGICVQDHGVPPPGESHLDYRHRLFRERLDEAPFPHRLLYEASEIPETFNRLRTAAADAAALEAAKVYVMDSGMAAILGATRDVHCLGRDRVMVLDVATSHTVGAAFEGDELAGFFEYHTKDITTERLDDLLVRLADGRLEHAEILEQGGHGAYCLKGIGFDRVEVILSTGPQRRRISDSRHPITPGAPLGDNMMTGTAGLLTAIRRWKGLPPPGA